MKNQQYKYLAVILTIIAMCLVWFVVKDITIGSIVLHADTQQQSKQIRKSPAEEKEMREIWKRWTFLVRDEQGYAGQRAFKSMFVEAIQAGYIPRFTIGKYDLLFMEKKK